MRHAFKPGALLSRREAAGSFFLALGGVALFACTASKGSTGDEADDSDSSGATGADSGSDSSVGTSGAWASGGTKSMTAVATYPNPFAAATTCALLVAATEGPCTETADFTRSDVSEGYSGLPLRLALQIVDASCNPIVGAKVKIWHTQLTGSYSGNTPNTNMCLKSTADTAKHYFRGVQTSDDEGVVTFDSCFPGWYSSRTPHIHFTITVDGKTFTSQLVFAQDLVNEIFTSHEEYSGFGLPDTTNAKDNVVGRGDIASYTLTVARMDDGAMLASKRIVMS